MNDTWNSDDIDAAKAELIQAGWVEKTPTLWKSPTGSLHVGPAGAWREMKRAQNDTGMRTRPKSSWELRAVTAEQAAREHEQVALNFIDADREKAERLRELEAELARVTQERDRAIEEQERIRAFLGDASPKRAQAYERMTAELARVTQERDTLRQQVEILNMGDEDECACERCQQARVEEPQ